MIFMKLMSVLRLTGAFIYKNRAAIETIAGMALVAGGTAVVISKAKEAANIAYDVEQMMDDIHEADAHEEWENKKERSHAVRHAVGYAAKNYTKCYALGVGMEVAGLVLIGVSDFTMSKELSVAWGMVSSYAATLNNIKERVIADQGEEKWNEYYLGPRKTEVNVLEDGTVIQTTTPVENPNKKANLPPFTIMFGPSNPNYEKDPMANRDFLEKHEFWLDQKLDKKEWLTFNDICDDIGAELDKSIAGANAIISKYDENGSRNHFSFGLGRLDEATQRFRDGVETDVILCPNVIPNGFDLLLKTNKIKLI